MLKPTRPLSDYEVDEKAASATAILNDPIISEAINNLHQKYVEELIASGVGSPEALSAQAGMKMLVDFKSELQSMITERQMRVHRRRSTS
jgi:hypothetical protein